MRKKWKIALGAVFGVVVLSNLIFQTLKPLEVSLMKVEAEDISKKLTEEGIVLAEEEKYISSIYGGKITGINVREGDKVKKGDILITFDTQEIAYQIQSLQGELRSIQAQKDLQELTVDLETKKLLYEAGIISKKDYEDARYTIHSDYYPALISAVRAQIDLLYYQASQRNAISASDGIVTNLQVEEGMVVAPGTQLTTIISGDSYTVETYVLTEDASRLEPGMEVTLIQKNKSGDIIFSGNVDRIAPTAVEKISALGLVEQRLRIAVIPEIPKNLSLKPGYSLDVEFTIDKKEGQLVVPKTVLFPYKDGEALWVVEQGQAAVRTVIKGFENDRDTAITEGLQEGDLIILNPKAEGLTEGKRINTDNI